MAFSINLWRFTGVFLMSMIKNFIISLLADYGYCFAGQNTMKLF